MGIYILLQHYATNVNKSNWSYASSDGRDTGSDKDANSGDNENHESEFL